MNFKDAFKLLKQGEKIKLPSWGGYWIWEDDTIKMYCRDGKILDIREAEDVNYTFSNVASDEWEIADETNAAILGGVLKFSFSEALKQLKNGKKVSRAGWNGKGMFVVYQKGYPEGIPCNKQTAEAWGINEGDLFKCEPYLQIQMVNGSHAMWVPSINDVLAEDWTIVQ